MLPGAGAAVAEAPLVTAAGPGATLVLIKGAGEMASGVAWRLARCGFRVAMTDLPQPLAIRRTVAFCSALSAGRVTVDGVTAQAAPDAAAARVLLAAGVIPVLADPAAACRAALQPDVLVDGIMAKRNLGTAITDAATVVALGPGFFAGLDCDAVVETQRGHDLGRVYYAGSAIPDTGVPAERGGYGAPRVVRAPADGRFRSTGHIGEYVHAGSVVGFIEPGAVAVHAAIDGVVRGLIHDGFPVTAGLKMGDVDPLADRRYCFTISDKALAVAGGVLEAVLALSGRR